MWLNHRLRPPRHVLLSFLAIMFVLAAAWTWLGLRLLQQERALERQRIQERLDHAADLVAAGLFRSLSSSEERLAALLVLPDARPATAGGAAIAKDLSDDALITFFDSHGVRASPSGRLLYYPFLPEPKGPAESVFAAGEVLEFQQKDYSKASEFFRKLVRSADAGTRAGALVRLARTLRKARQLSAALAVYDQLAQMDSETVAGLPAELLALQGRCELLEELRQLPELEHEALVLARNLQSSRWRLTRSAYLFYEQQARRWIKPNQEVQTYQDAGEPAALALAAGVESLWEEWQRIRVGEGATSGRRSVWFYNRPVLVLWRSSSERLVGLVAGRRYFEERLLTPSRALIEREGVQIELTDAEGHQVPEPLPGGAIRQAVRSGADSHLPWTLHVASRNPGVDAAQLSGRRRLLIGGLALIAMVVVLGGYFIARAMMRELEVAQLQSDFVSAASHEFRTPLASLRQLSEMLADGRVPSDERRQQYYQLLSQESERLHRLVEGLLDFGRMEAGAKEYRFELLDPQSLVSEVAEEFAPKAQARGFQVELNASNGVPPVLADREALSRAVWNLLDNAVKYSPGGKQLWIETRREGSRAAICVRDQGLGIAPGDQPQIFKKFVRGASARAAGVKGTGLGLAMVQGIVAAHHGEIRLESQPGVGSTFTVLLPEARR